MNGCNAGSCSGPSDPELTAADPCRWEPVSRLILSGAAGAGAASGPGSGPPSAIAVSIVVPCYRSAGSLPELVRRLAAQQPLLGDYEVILVCDASPDDTWESIRRVAAEDAHVRGVLLARNFGQHNALLCGISASRGALVVTMDDDLQHPPEELSKLFAALVPGVDLVYGLPERETHGLVRDLASVATKSAMDRATGNRVKDTGAFRLFRGHLREVFRRYNASFVSIDVLLSWGTTRMVAVPVRHDVRKLGVSGYTLRKLVRHAVTMITGYTVWPLRLASYIGFVFFALGGLMFLYVVLGYLLRGSPVQGFTFLAAAVTLFSGVQLFCLGIMGEYLARVYYRTMDRPPYLVRETVGGTIQQ